MEGAVGVVGAVEGAVGSVEGAVGSVEGVVGSVEGAVGSVEGVVGSVEGWVGSVEGVVGSVEGVVGSVEGVVGSVEGVVGSVEGCVGGWVGAGSTGPMGSGSRPSANAGESGMKINVHAKSSTISKEANFFIVNPPEYLSAGKRQDRVLFLFCNLYYIAIRGFRQLSGSGKKPRK